MRALARANEIRCARARLKRNIANGTLTAAELLLSPPRELERLALAELLRCQPQWGPARTRGFIARNGLDERKPIGGFTDRQRTLLARQLATHADS
jgi:hypothetical protein